MHRSPAPGYGSSRTFGQKLGIYLAGVAIGLLFLGWVQVRKHQAASAAQGQPAAPGTASGTPLSDEPSDPPASPEETGRTGG